MCSIQICFNVILMAVLKTDVSKQKMGTYPRWVPDPSGTHILDNAPAQISVEVTGKRGVDGMWLGHPFPPNYPGFPLAPANMTLHTPLKWADRGAWAQCLALSGHSSTCGMNKSGCF